MLRNAKKTDTKEILVAINLSIRRTQRRHSRSEEVMRNLRKIKKRKKTDSK